jgi:hypothetical protein
MQISTILAGTLLARLGRPEALNCIGGLDQYSYSYEEAGDQAADMKRIYNSARYGEFDFSHMASVVPRVGAVESNHGMMVDEPPLRRSDHTPMQTVRADTFPL